MADRTANTLETKGVVGPGRPPNSSWLPDFLASLEAPFLRQESAESGGLRAGAPWPMIRAGMAMKKTTVERSANRSCVVVCLFGLLLGGACATPPAVTSDGLALKRVVIYRNGVAYFEREGRVRGNKVGFRVRRDEVGDFLASFAVMERTGGTVRAASFPMHREEEPPPVPVEGQPAPVPKPDPKRKLENVVMELDGGVHDLAVGYIAEAPVWRPSYRLVLQKEKVRLQVWGIVQNLSGEDWKNARLTLVADAPLALQTGLETAVIPSRPVLAEGNEVIMVVPQSETSLAEAPPPPPPAPAAAPPSEAMAEEAFDDATSGVGGLAFEKKKAKGDREAGGQAPALDGEATRADRTPARGALAHPQPGGPGRGGGHRRRYSLRATEPGHRARWRGDHALAPRQGSAG